MNQLDEKKLAITKLIDALYINPAPFESFVTQLLNIDVIRFNFDALTNESQFYTKDAYICSLARKDLVHAQKNETWDVGQVLNTIELQRIIKILDEGQLSVVEFHRLMLLNGVASCHVYLIPRKIYYLGSDAQYYLENY